MKPTRTTTIAKHFAPATTPSRKRNSGQTGPHLQFESKRSWRVSRRLLLHRVRHQRVQRRPAPRGFPQTLSTVTPSSTTSSNTPRTVTRRLTVPRVTAAGHPHQSAQGGARGRVAAAAVQPRLRRSQSFRLSRSGVTGSEFRCRAFRTSLRPRGQHAERRIPAVTPTPTP